ncbi:MAG: hypothetical protein P4L42_13010 [Desulfocapsaceae bacterium]|nr:hypothetical protein [Desulfocapsaceae bacterium]
MTAIAPASPFSSLLPAPVSWLLCLICSLAVFLAPALWNGFPIVFFDTGGYVDGVLEMVPFPGRSFFYGMFLWAASWGWWSFWGPVLAQSLFTLWVIHLMLRCHDLPAGPQATALLCFALGVSTSISWYTSQLMPDILVPLAVLALWLLSFRWEKLRRSERAGLAALALLGILSHMSCMALAIGLAGIVAIVKIFGRRQGQVLTPSSWAAAAVVAAGLMLMPMTYLALTGKATYTPGGPDFIFGKLVQDGIAQRWLRDNCPAPGIKLCELQDRMPKTADEFLWGVHSPFQDIGEWSGAADAELSHLVKSCVRAYAGSVAWGALRATVQQMAMVKTGDGLLEFHAITRGVFTNALPRTAKPFNAANQQQGGIKPSVFRVLNLLHIPVACLSVFGLIIAISRGLGSGRHEVAGLASFMLSALFGNALICGALSGPHNRYQNRLVWLATLAVCLTFAGLRQVRMEKENLQKGMLPR